MAGCRACLLRPERGPSLGQSAPPSFVAVAAELAPIADGSARDARRDRIAQTRDRDALALLRCLPHKAMKCPRGDGRSLSGLSALVFRPAPSIARQDHAPGRRLRTMLHWQPTNHRRQRIAGVGLSRGSPSASAFSIRKLARSTAVLVSGAAKPLTCMSGVISATSNFICSRRKLGLGASLRV
jgi:hypothetical protein